MLSLVLVAGFGIPAFAVDDAGNNMESGDPISSPTQSSSSNIAFPAATNVVTNGDFETGNLNGWTTFLTPNGVINPTVVLFDTDGDTVATQSAQFQVGEIPNNLGGGGGIFQNVNTPAGTVMISADIAAFPTQFTNSECGIFRMLFDNVEVDMHQFGGGPSNCQVGTVYRSQLFAEVNGVSAGSHEVKIEMTRPFTTGSGPGNTPFQYIDNVQVLTDMAVGGESLSFDSSALLMAGISANLSIIVPIAAGIAGVGAYYIRSRIIKE